MSTADQLADLLFDDANHRYKLAGVLVPGVTSVLESAGLIDYRFLGARREEYLRRGRDVHAATHADDLDSLDESTVQPEYMGYVQAWRAFRRDYGFTADRLEHRVCNRQYGFAGTLDRTGAVRDGSHIILDIKSGVAPRAVRFQLAAYASCLLHPRSRRRRCVEVHADGSYRVIGYETREYEHDFNVFLCALKLWKEKNR